MTNRVGSYAFNFWLLAASHDPMVWAPWPPISDFTAESQVQRPASTPVIADSRSFAAQPLAADPPPTNLVWGWTIGLPALPSGPLRLNGLNVVALPRHGSRPNPVPTYWPPSQPLPGAVNVAFFDGHGETVKLDWLWQLYWHPDYKPPDKRPRL